METWFRRVLLSLTLATVTGLPSYSVAQEADDEDATVLDAIISPDLKRRKIEEDKIDSEDFEIGAFAGVMNVEDFGSNNLYGIHFSYHINQDLFIDLTYAETETGLSSSEVLGSAFPLFPLDDRDLIFYNASIGVNLFPGEIFMGHKYSFNTNFYFIGGVGTTEWAGDDYFTYNFGAGMRIFVTDWIAARADFRNHLFTHQKLGAEKSVQNLEGHIGLSFFF